MLILRPSAFNWRELRRTQLEIKRQTMDTWFSAIDGLLGGIQKTEDPFITALKKDVILYFLCSTFINIY